MGFDHIVRIIGLVMLGVVIFGWVIPYQKSFRNNKILQLRQWGKAFVDRQISELYGPMEALINEQNIRMAYLQHQLGRQTVFKGNGGLDDLTPDEKKIWIHYVDTYAIPFTNKILNLLNNKRDLLYESACSEEVMSFYKYAVGFELASNQYQNNVPNNYQYHGVQNYPEEFNYYVHSSLQKLLLEQRNMMPGINKVSSVKASDKVDLSVEKDR